ncbi:MAG: hypothetical protein ICV60_17305, partial [Pyrinomonadaceae bacterium]|nr:hypothetical protein [Pyrinomonadaceae bacterium]
MSTNPTPEPNPTSTTAEEGILSEAAASLRAQQPIADDGFSILRTIKCT